MQAIIVSLLLLVSPATPAVHDFHLSKALVEYNEKEQAIQVSMHIFLDDLEEALRRKGLDDLYFCTKKEDEYAEAYMEAYLREHFTLTINGQETEYNFLGKEPSGDFQGAWCYIEVKDVSQLNEISIRNDLLMEIFEDQKNVIQLIGPNNKRGTLLLQRGREEETVKF
ncbi:MAG TPA: DUF6702 family protein [Saprospiraceae bacterium]|nr:DUF6702 family protein [Saprospiraceae bacterium]